MVRGDRRALLVKPSDSDLALSKRLATPIPLRRARHEAEMTPVGTLAPRQARKRRISRLYRLASCSGVMRRAQVRRPGRLGSCNPRSTNGGLLVEAGSGKVEG